MLVLRACALASFAALSASRAPIEAVASTQVDDELRAHFECAARCASMPESDRAILENTWRSVGCEEGGPGAHPICGSSMEQLCVGACGGGQQDMTTWLPGAFGSRSPGIAEKQIAGFAADYEAHHACSARCAQEGVSVDAAGPDAAERALETLNRCGVVQLVGAYELTELDRFQRAFDALKSKATAYKKLLDTKQLHDGRSQVYLPFTTPFTSRKALGVGDLVHGVLAKYFRTSGMGFGIDHASVLVSASHSGNQSLHPDVPYFKGLTVSVHTALRDVTTEMGWERSAPHG
ncbi:unnamed protein product, partial [Polarella glacialis]